jgi:hypothetical protein
MHMQRITGANNEWIYSIRGDGETGFFVNKLRYGAGGARGGGCGVDCIPLTMIALQIRHFRGCARVQLERWPLYGK